MKMHRFLCFALAVAVSILFAQEQRLDNQAILKLVKAGMSDDVIVSLIKQQPGNFDLAADKLIELKSAGVSDKVIAAMLNKNAAAPETAPNAPASPATGPFTEIGVYYKKGGQWTDVLPEVVNWKTGGVLKKIGTAGIVKEDINGHIPGPHSRNSVALPAEFMIFTAEGVAITEYQLLRLRAKGDYREFRTITGGVLHQKSGAMRDMVPFEGKKVGNRLFSVILPGNLGAGDYGFLWLGSTGGAGGLTSLSMGKMYTFRVVE